MTHPFHCIHAKNACIVMACQLPVSGCPAPTSDIALTPRGRSLAMQHWSLRVCCLTSGDSHVINNERAASAPVFRWWPIKRGRLFQRKNFKSFSKRRKPHWRRQLSFISAETVLWGQFDRRILYILMHWQKRLLLFSWERIVCDVLTACRVKSRTLLFG
jgi:hypothetical protein